MLLPQMRRVPKTGTARPFPFLSAARYIYFFRSLKYTISIRLSLGKLSQDGRLFQLQNSEYEEIIMEKFKNTTRTVEEELSRERKFWKQNQLWSIVLAAVVLFGLLGKSGISVAPGPEELMLTMHDGSTAVVAYEAITSAQLLDTADYGTVTAGRETRYGSSGTWEHPQWGSYTLCAYASSSLCVRIETDHGSYVLNLPSEDETRQLFRLIQDRIPASR